MAVNPFRTSRLKKKAEMHTSATRGCGAILRDANSRRMNYKFYTCRTGQSGRVCIGMVVIWWVVTVDSSLAFDRI